MIVLGLDPSLTGFGWCVHRSDVGDSDRVIAKGVWSSPASRVFIWRYMYMRESVGHLLDAHPEIQAIGVESPPFGELWSEGLYGLFLYVTEAIFVRQRDVVFFDPSSVKLLARMDPQIRKGTMDKQSMIEAARGDTGIKRWNHNEADAFIIARSAARFWEFQMGGICVGDLTPSEQHVFARTHKTRTGEVKRRGIVFREDDRFHRFSVLSPDDVAIDS